MGAVHSRKLGDPDLSLFCIWTVRRAFEETSRSNVDNAAAATWFVNAGPAIHDFGRKTKSFEGKLAKPGSSFHNEDWTGFSQDRWQVWRQRADTVQLDWLRLAKEYVQVS